MATYGGGGLGVLGPCSCAPCCHKRSRRILLVALVALLVGAGLVGGAIAVWWT